MLFIFLFFFFPHWEACMILVPWPGIEPVPSAVKMHSPNHWTSREFLVFLISLLFPPSLECYSWGQRFLSISFIAVSPTPRIVSSTWQHTINTCGVNRYKWTFHWKWKKKKKTQVQRRQLLLGDLLLGKSTHPLPVGIWWCPFPCLVWGLGDRTPSGKTKGATRPCPSLRPQCLALSQEPKNRWTTPQRGGPALKEFKWQRWWCTECQLWLCHLPAICAMRVNKFCQACSAGSEKASRGDPK